MIQANERIVTLKLKRSCVVKMMLAAIRYALDEPLDEFGRRVWTELYEELRKQLDDFDTARTEQSPTCLPVGLGL